MPSVYEIGPFRLDTVAGMLTYGDAPAPLGPRGVAVLRVLVERAHEFVAKKDIIDAAWPGVVVEENNLAAQISAIRHAFAQTPEGVGWIETLARRGYRFVGPVTEIAARPSRPPRPARQASGVPHDWERRHLAFLRARFVASSATDIAPVLTGIAQEVRRLGGEVEASSPDELVAIFGLEPSDNAPSHAALAARAIHGAAAHARATSKWHADIAIAIDGRDHWVRRRAGRFEIAHEAKLGLWSGLDSLAAAERPGATYVSAAVAPFLARRFMLESPPDRQRGGWMLLAREAMPMAWTPFVGRSSELATLIEASARASRGQAQVVGIVGEAGVGKSRLVHEFVPQLQGWRVLDGGCAPYAVKTPYFSLARMLKSYCRVDDADRADEVRDKVAESIPMNAADPVLLLPALFDLLGVLPEDDAFLALDPALRRRRTHDALRQLFLAAATMRPLCLIVEDLQWIDVSTREVLDALVNGLADARLLLLAVYRPEYQHAWGHKACYRQVRVDALSVEHAGDMLDTLLGADGGLAQLKRHLAQHGNPFYLEETLRALVEMQTLQGRRGDYRLTCPVQALQVPATVQAILSARVHRLAPQDRRLLQVASTIGVDVPLALLASIAELSEEPLRRGLEALEAAEFLHQTGLHPNLKYTFKHALTHEVTYGTLPDGRRRALHAHIVRAIESTYAERLTEHVERLAHHALRGEMWEAAVSYLHQAGIKALARSGNREAAECFDQALAALGHCPERRETLERAIDLRFDLKTALIPVGAFERIVAHLRDAEALVRKLDDPRRLGQFYVHMCQTLGLSGNSVEARGFGENAQALADSLGDLPLQVTGTLFLGMACFSTLDYRRAEVLFRKVLRLVDGTRCRERFGLAGFPAVSARAYLTRIAGDQGRFEQGAREGQEGIHLAESLDHPYSLSIVSWCLADLLVTKGDLAQAVALLEQGIAIARLWNLPFFAAGHAGSLGYAYALLGRADEGIPLMEQALRVFEAMGHSFALSLFLVPLGEACLLAGRPDDAFGHARRALTLAREGAQRAGEAGALRLLGDIASHREIPEDAEQHYRSALALATELEMRPLAAHCHMGLGRLGRRTSRHTDSERNLAIGKAMYRDMGMRHWFALADATEAAQ